MNRRTEPLSLMVGLGCVVVALGGIASALFKVGTPDLLRVAAPSCLIVVGVIGLLASRH